MTQTRILLADDHELFRHGLMALLNSQPDLLVIGQAKDGFEALKMARDLRPDLIIMDITMPLCDGVQATRLIREGNYLPDGKIVMLTILDDDEKLLEAVASGADGYLLKGSSQTDFLAGVRGVAAGEAILPPRLAARLLKEYASLASQQESPSPNRKQVDLSLSPREQDVLDLIAVRLTDKEIASQLSLSLHTVKSHVRSILSKLHVVNRRQAVKEAVRQGLLSNE